MAITVKNGYQCGYCGKFYTNPIAAENCKDSHNLIYVPFTKEDLNRLINFIYSKEEKLLTETLITTLQKYLKGSFNIIDIGKKDAKKEM
jgi:hypothetical protein